MNRQILLNGVLGCTVGAGVMLAAETDLSDVALGFAITMSIVLALAYLHRAK